MQRATDVCSRIFGTHDLETFFVRCGLYHGYHGRPLSTVNPTWHAQHCENPRKFGQTQVQQLKPIKMIYGLA